MKKIFQKILSMLSITALMIPSVLAADETINVAENTVNGEVVFDLDSDHYRLVGGVGSEDNDKFTIDGNKLKLNFEPDYENPVDNGDTAGNNTYALLIQDYGPRVAKFAEIDLNRMYNSDENGVEGVPENANGDTNYGGLYSSNNTANYSGYAIITNNGRIKVWGEDNYGGDQREVDALELNPGETFIKIYSNKSSYAALTSEGRIKVWGNSYEGGDQNDVDIIELNPGELFTKVYSNQKSYAALTSEGRIKVWGDDIYGGDQSEVDAIELNPGESFTKIHSNFRAFAALTSDGRIKVWGEDNYGGDQREVDALELNPGETFIKIYSNKSSYAALTSEGRIKVWGNSYEGGDQNDVDIIELNPGELFTKVYSNQKSYAALTSEGRIKVWGDDIYGGDQSEVDAIELNPGESFTKIHSNFRAFAALTSDGRIKVWGEDNYGGDQREVDALELNPGETFTKIYSTENLYFHNSIFAALTSEGRIKVWGEGNYGGDQSEVDAIELNPGETFTKIFSNEGTFAALTSEGRIKVWGEDYSGGDQSEVDAIELNPGETFTKIYTNAASYAALTSDGRIKVRGADYYAGDQNKVNEIELNPGETYKNIYSNWQSYAALTSEGRIKVWGGDRNGGNQSEVDSVMDYNNLTMRTIKVTITDIDEKAPSVTLNGDREVTLEVGEEYTELGATCEDTDTTCEIITRGTVDTSTPGEYTIEYEAKDENGNISETIMRFVTVQEKSSNGGTTFRPEMHNASDGHKSSDTSEQTEMQEDISEFLDDTLGSNEFEDESDIQDDAQEDNDEITKQDLLPRLKVYDSCNAIERINNIENVQSKFVDTKFSRYAPSIESLEYAKVVDGITPHYFGTDRSVTRAEFLKIILRTHCLDYTQQETLNLAFTDVDKNTWMAKVISKALEEEIIDISDDKTFRPNEAITKLESTKILMNMTFKILDEDLTSGYADFDKNDWEAKYIAQGEQIGLFRSIEEKRKFNPNEEISRDKMAYFVEKMINLYDTSKQLVTDSDYPEVG